ncbi:class I SAM-dependent methyltransferase [Nocardia inohanensis]|uniref:class I SAM-dependent methyltransferase n=1 Tax=Nocardia inohanensis TaxID=209246 RepID=UPI000832009F|nr:class I SAM-dependent methyltransferase [Nocardia inohanensis]
MNKVSIDSPYATGASRQAIEAALVAAGRDPARLTPADLALVEDFHTMGRIATLRLVDSAGLTAGSRVLDAGSGIGGTARFVADRYGCRVHAVDITADYCATNAWLNQVVGLADRIVVSQGDVTAVPFDDASFDVVLSQHVQMNVADKVGLYREARRVLVPGGRLALWDITAGAGAAGFPLPWADRPEQSRLVAPDRLRDTIEAAGFVIEEWNDLTTEAVAVMRAVLASPPDSVGLQAFVPDFATKAANLTQALDDGGLRAVQGLAHAK